MPVVKRISEISVSEISPGKTAEILNLEGYLLWQLHRTSQSYKNHKRFKRIMKGRSSFTIPINQLFHRNFRSEKSVATDRKNKSRLLHPLSEFLICEECGNKLKLCTSISHRTGKRLYRFDCCYHIRYREAYCFSHSIAADRLYISVLYSFFPFCGNI